MVLNTKEFKEACQTILYAIDTKGASLYTETLELVASGQVLNLNVTNRAYFATVKFSLQEGCEFRAAVNAKKFLSLISKITTNTVDLSVNKNSLVVTANGKYTLPMIYNNDQLIKLPRIEMGEITNEMDIQNSILQSILVNNSKELTRGLPTKPVQEYYYIDELGAITFTTGACVNSFTLPKEIKLLLSDKVVKLFKLFKGDGSVKFTMGQSAVYDDTIQTKVCFKNDKVELTTKLTDSSLITGVPVSAIRGMANKTFPYTMVLEKEAMSQALNRVMIFNSDDTDYGNISVKGCNFTISDFNNGSYETIQSTSEPVNVSEYNMILNLKALKSILDGCEEDYLTMCFGDNKAVVFKKNSITDLIPEQHIK